MTTLLTALSALAVLLFLGVVAIALTKIASTLEAIGGRGDSYLAKLRLGLRAIERETSHLPAAAVPLNQGLGQAAAGLKAIDQGLGQLHAALIAQERK
jgi:X-X-X-Leu-X-X-Gly heptad repeat protein